MRIEIVLMVVTLLSMSLLSVITIKLTFRSMRHMYIGVQIDGIVYQMFTSFIMLVVIIATLLIYPLVLVVIGTKVLHIYLTIIILETFLITLMFLNFKSLENMTLHDEFVVKLAKTKSPINRNELTNKMFYSPLTVVRFLVEFGLIVIIGLMLYTMFKNNFSDMYAFLQFSSFLIATHIIYYFVSNTELKKIHTMLEEWYVSKVGNQPKKKLNKQDENTKDV